MLRQIEQRYRACPKCGYYTHPDDTQHHPSCPWMGFAGFEVERGVSWFNCSNEGFDVPLPTPSVLG